VLIGARRRRRRRLNSFNIVECLSSTTPLPLLLEDDAERARHGDGHGAGARLEARPVV